MLRKITLAWDAEAGAAGYKIYYGTASDSYTTAVNVGNVTTYPLTLADGHTYYLAATAYDSANAESDFSNEISLHRRLHVLFLHSFSHKCLRGCVRRLRQRHGNNPKRVLMVCLDRRLLGHYHLGSSGTGSGTVAYTVAANTGSTRTASSTIAGKALYDHPERRLLLLYHHRLRRHRRIHLSVRSRERHKRIKQVLHHHSYHGLLP